MANRNEKIQEQLMHAAAEFLVREANQQSLITVTNTMLSPDAKRATVFITVLPESAEEAALSFAKRHAGELAQYFRGKVRGAYPPHIEFAIDRGEKNRQRLDELSK